MDRIAEKFPTAAPRTALALIVLMGGILRVATLPAEEAWYDELLVLSPLEQPTLGAYLNRIYLRNLDVQPVYFVAVYVWTRVTGSSELAVRALSVGFGLALIWLTYLLGKLAFGVRAGLIAAALVATNPSHI